MITQGSRVIFSYSQIIYIRVTILVTVPKTSNISDCCQKERCGLDVIGSQAWQLPFQIKMRSQIKNHICGFIWGWNKENKASIIIWGRRKRKRKNLPTTGQSTSVSCRARAGFHLTRPDDRYLSMLHVACASESRDSSAKQLLIWDWDCSLGRLRSDPARFLKRESLVRHVI